MEPQHGPENPTPNPEAVAWYLGRAEGLLDDLRDRVSSLRTRGGQLAGFSGAVIALVGSNADAISLGLQGSARMLAGTALLVGVALLIGAFAVALHGIQLAQVVSDLSVAEISNYRTARFICEPDLWRVQARALNGLVHSVDAMTRQGDRVSSAVTWAGRLFLLGLVSVGAALAILISIRTF